MKVNHQLNIHLFNIYRPLPPLPYCQHFSTFLNQFSSFLSYAATTAHEFIITDDFNTHADDMIDTQTIQFFTSSVVISLSMLKFLHGHILDLVITLASTTLNLIITTSFIVTSDYYPIFTNLPPHLQSSPIAVSTPLTTLNLLLTLA